MSGEGCARGCVREVVMGTTVYVVVEDGHEWNTVLAVCDSEEAAERYLRIRHPRRGHVEEHAVKGADAAVAEVLDILGCEHVTQVGIAGCPKCHTTQREREAMAARLVEADNERGNG